MPVDQRWWTREEKWEFFYSALLFFSVAGALTVIAILMRLGLL